MNTCVACSSKLRALGQYGQYTIYKCSGCGLGVTFGRSSIEKYGAYHRDKTYQAGEKQFKNIFSKRVAIIDKFAEPGRVLEVGSSTGFFLLLLKEKGWKVQGVEPSKNAATQAKGRGIPTIEGTFEQASLASETFDLVVFNHVLEHMEKPLDVLSKVNKLLKKEGLVFIDVPNFASLSAKLHGIWWKYILPEEHKWHFTKDSLAKMFKNGGFEVIYTETRSGIWDYGDPLKEFWQSLAGFKKRFFTNLVTAVPTYIVGRLGLGTGLTIIARK